MKLTVLASGSKANAAILKTVHNGSFLIDAGLSAAVLELKMQMAGLDPRHLSGIFITHEHNDHTAGLAVFAKRYRLAVYTNSMTAHALEAKCSGVNWHCFKTGDAFDCNSSITTTLGVQTFPVCHDAAEPCGFVFIEGDIRFAFATDLGTVDAPVLKAAEKATTFFLEANYDEQLLASDLSRPWRVKERIASNNGHLSNQEAAKALSGALNLRKVILGHLSSATNSPRQAIHIVGTALAGRAEVACAYVPERERCKPPQVIDIL